MKFRKRPVIIDAVQWTINTDCCIKFCEGNAYYSELEDCIYIKTLEGEMKCKSNDFIIKGVRGEFYPCKPGIFKETYEKV